MSTKSKRLLSFLLALIMTLGLVIPGVPAFAAASNGSGATALITSEQMEAFKFIDRTLRAEGLIGFDGDYALAGSDTVSVIVEFKAQPPKIQMAEAEVNGGPKIAMSAATRVALDAHSQFRMELDAMMNENSTNGISTFALTPNYEITSEYYDALNGVALSIPADKVEALSALDSVWAVYPNAIVQVETDNALADPNASAGMKESRDYLGIKALHDAGLTGEGIVVGVLDSGVDYNHPSLKDAFATELPKEGSTLEKKDGKYYGRNFVQRDSYPYFQFVLPQANNDPMETTYYEYTSTGANNLTITGAPVSWMDYVTAHGTHVAGTIAGRGTGENADSAVLGIAPGATLISYRVLGPFGAGYTEWILGGLDSVYGDGCDVVNMSLGASENNPAYVTTLAVNNLIVAHDITFVIAGGNDGPTIASMGSPGTSSLAITVANGVTPMITHNLYATQEVGGYGKDTIMRQLTSDGKTKFEFIDYGFFGEVIISGGALKYDKDSGDGWYEMIALKNTNPNTDDTYTDMTKWNYDYTEVEYDFLLGRGTESDFAALAKEIVGKIVIVGRGLPFVEVAERAKKYGAGMVIMLDYPGGGEQPDSFFVSDPSYAPLFLLRDHWNGKTSTNVNGYAWLQDYLMNDAKTTWGSPKYDKAKEVVCAVISFAKYMDIEAPITLNSTSSTGPVSGTMDIKPDVTAPGTSIASSVPYFITAANKTDAGASGAYRGALGSMSGTSMASPHVAGIAALMMQYSNKTWSSAEIKARMMNTADAIPGSFSVYEVGAGFVNPAAALDSEAFVTVAYNDVYLPSAGGSLSNERGSGSVASLNFRSVMVNQEREQTVDLAATLTNNGSAKTFELSYEVHTKGFAWSNNDKMLADINKWDSSGVTIKHPETLTVGANTSVDFTVSAVAPDYVNNQHTGIYEGYVILTNKNDKSEVYKLPFALYLRPESQMGTMYLNHPAITTNGVFYSATNPQTGDYEPGVWVKDDANNVVHNVASYYSSFYFELGEPASYIYFAIAPGDIDDINDQSQWLGETGVGLSLNYTDPGYLYKELWLIGPAYFEYERDDSGNISIDPMKMTVLKPGHYKIIAMVVSPFGSTLDAVDLYVDNEAPKLSAPGLSGNVFTYSGGSRDEVTIKGNIYDDGLAELAKLGIDYNIYEPTDPHGPKADQALNAIFALVKGAPNGPTGEPVYSQADIQPNGDFELTLTGLDADGSTTVDLYPLDHFAIEDYQGITGVSMTYEFNPDNLCMVKTFGYPFAFNGANMEHKTITVNQTGAAVTLNIRSAVRYAGGSLGLVPTINEAAAALGYNSVTWSSSDERVVKVDDDGIVTVVDWGTATVTCSIKNAAGDVIYAGCKVYVPGNHDGVNFDPFANIWMGQYEYSDYPFEFEDMNANITKADDPYSILIYGEDEEYFDWENFMTMYISTFIGERSRIPMMWDYKGEEMQYGLGDRMLTLMSSYNLTTMKYNEDDKWSTYGDSDLNEYLNGEFIDDSFSASEQSAIPEYTVTSGIYDKDGDLKGEEVLKNQRAYLPWGITGSTAGKFSNYVFWSAGNELDFDQSFKGASTWKNHRRNRDLGTVQWASYYLRNQSPNEGEVLYSKGYESDVRSTSNWNYYAKPLNWYWVEGVGGWGESEVGYAVSPAVKVDWNSILGVHDVLTSETARGINENLLYTKIDENASYKLSLVGGNDGADVGTLNGVSTDAKSIATGASLSFSVTPSKFGTTKTYDKLYDGIDGNKPYKNSIGNIKEYAWYYSENYVIAYKVVGGSADNRSIVKQGEIAATSAGAHNLNLGSFSAGDYMVYIYLMNKCDRQSYEVGTVYSFPLYVANGANAPAPSIDRQPQDASVMVGEQASLNVIANVSSPSAALSYQWFGCEENGENATLIEGATGRVYDAAASGAGVSYYYVAVTSSIAGKSDVTLTSDVVSVTVAAIDVEEPAASIADGAFIKVGTTVSVSCENEDAVVEYKLSESADFAAYNGPIAINAFNSNATSANSVTLYIRAALDTTYSDVVEYTYYELNTVTFDSNGGNAVAPQDVHNKATAIEPADPEKDGYTFLGWYLGGSLYDFDAPVNGNITLTAAWEKEKEPETVKLVSVTPSASVEKQNGNKNKLTITVTETYSDGTTKVFTWSGSIDNNAAGTYTVGGYKVYVDTKGNTQIRECYIVK